MKIFKKPVIRAVLILSFISVLICVWDCSRVWRYKQKCMKYSKDFEIVARYLKELEYESIDVDEKEALEGLITVIENHRTRKEAVENSEAAEALKRVFADAKCEVIYKTGLQVFFQFTSTLDTSAGIAFSLATPKDFYHDGDQFNFLEALREHYYYYETAPKR
ncbi:MAG: hypothetical protein IJU78_08465 [Clostridia bacterium]|nr:hypothetical protein [Clostridia bacterium]